MAIFTGTLATDPPSDLAKLANDGRVNLVSSTSIRWDGSVVGLWNGSSWAVCKPATLPSAINTSTDMNGTALAVDKIYDVFLNYSSMTSCPFAFSRWAVSTTGSSARNAAYAAGTAYAIGDRVTSGGKDYTCIQAGTGQTPSSSPTYWVDNGTSITGDFAGLYRHDGVLVSHNSDAGKKLRWLGCVYTYSNSGTVNFKDDTTYRYISNYYNWANKDVKTYCNNNAAYTYTTAAIREVLNQVKGHFVCCVAVSSVFMGIYQAETTGTAPMLTYLGLNDTDFDGKVSITSVSRSNEAGVCLANISVSAGKHYITQMEYGGSGTPGIYGFSDRILASISIRA